MKGVLLVAAMALTGCESSGYNYAAPQQPQQQMDPNTRALMLMYGMQQLQQSMQPPAMPVQRGFICRPYPGGAVQCQ
jgi:hypothetical protein